MSQQAAAKVSTLTKYPAAGFRELLFLAFPLILSLFSASFMGFCDRLFLAHHSLEALEGCVSAGYLCILFQHPVIRIVSMAQVFVGLYKGSGQIEKIGQSVWQMIWLSFISMIITLPLSQVIAPLFFGGTAIEQSAMTYFSPIMAGNFLFPLGIALSAYFIGQGRTRIIFLLTLLSHGLNLGLDALLIFGIEGFIPSMGIFGAAIATVIAQCVFCVMLFIAFLRKNDREVFRTGEYHFNWDNFWGQLKVGLPRAIARVIILTAWVSIARIMTLKGGDYLMVLSVGGTLILLFTFINDGVCQAMITIASNLMGSKEYQKIRKMVRSALFLLFGTTALLSIPYYFIPEFTLSFFFSEPPSPESFAILKRSCIWLWLFFFCYGYHTIGLSLVTAARDVTFYMFAIMFVWITSFIPAYFAMNVWGWAPDKLWLIMALDSLLFGTIFLVRSTKENWKGLQPDPSLDRAT